jgi:hypothetical protein
MSKQERDWFFSGRKDENGKTVDRGIVGIRRPKAVEEIQARVRKLEEARALRNCGVGSFRLSGALMT